MKIHTLFFTCAALTAMPVMAMDDMTGMDMKQAAPAAQHQGRGVIRALNHPEHKVQIAHEAIATLHWPAMTMWFKASDALPATLKVGDTVQFELTSTDSKHWVITHIHARP